MTADNIAIADKLDEARALIERGAHNAADAVWGTFKGERPVRCSDPDFEVCLGAIRGLERALGAAALDNTALARWNEAPERTQAEVIEAFRKAAALARGGEK